MKNTVAGDEALVLGTLLEKVYQYGGYDFREYKRGTITRRLDRRLRAVGANNCLDYMRFLDAHPEEYQKLADDLTIKASSFFRSPYAFQQFAKLVLPELLLFKESGGEREIKFWSTACARGEEPYSMAVMLAEFLGQRWQDFNISIYATDISQWALNKAQAGRYSPEAVEGFSPARLQDYLMPQARGYEVRADIRQMVTFSYFDLTSTMQSPFMNLDCIFCCNVLIYWQKQLQERVLNMLYGSLANPGYLILGEVETPTGSFGDKLECLDNKARIYKKVT
ncbi:CheR family methyltransferase [Chloroflexota bacterium]